jgi:glycosyltransferase involved in cell wall biosynthesis
VIHNCFDDTVFVAGEAAGRPPGSFVFCGRLVSDKGCDLAIRALAEVRRANRAATLTIIGDGPEKGPLMQLAQALGVSDAVTFTGALPFREVAARLRAHRCTVVPSIWEEPFGIVVLEGLASGCEVIVTDRGGLPEALGGLGWAVDAKVEALAAAMLAVCEGESRRGAGVAHWLRAHSREAIARQYLDVIRKRLA